VTVIAGDTFVGTVYLEVATNVVIEQPQVPGDRVVAGFTVVRKPAGVFIVLQVASNALCVGIGKHRGFMAGLALEIVMFTKKRESRQIMVEAGCILPFCLGVTVAALVALLPVVNIVVKMAG